MRSAAGCGMAIAPTIAHSLRTARRSEFDIALHVRGTSARPCGSRWRHRVASTCHRTSSLRRCPRIRFHRVASDDTSVDSRAAQVALRTDLSSSDPPKAGEHRARPGVASSMHATRRPHRRHRLRKSTIARRLAEHGAVVVDADQVVRDVQRRARPCSPRSRPSSGTGCCGADGSLDRAALGSRVFGDPDARRAAQRDRASGGARRVAAAVRRGARRRPRRGGRLRRAAAGRGACRATRGS